MDPNVPEFPKQRRHRRTFSDEFKADCVRLCQAGDRNIVQVARDLDISVSAVRLWVKQAEIDAGKGPPGALTSEERAELARLRRENRSLAEDNAILKKAARYFARESQ